MSPFEEEARRRLTRRRQTLPPDSAELARLEAALRRLDAGCWGFCETCGGAIGRDRLRAMPDATLCLDCSSQSPCEGV